MAGTNTVYALVDPRDHAIRYVGITSVRPKKRLNEHLSRARKGDSSYRARWLRVLMALNLAPLLLILETTDNREREEDWIAVFRLAGARLTNVTDGGEGTIGYEFTEEQRKRLSEAHKGQKPTPEVRAILSSIHRGKPKSPEWREKIGAAQRGKVIPADQREKIGEASRRMWADPEIRARIAGSRRGMTLSAEHRRKISEAHKALPPRSAEWRANIAQSRLGKKHSAETLAKMSVASRARAEKRKAGE